MRDLSEIHYLSEVGIKMTSVTKHIPDGNYSLTEYKVKERTRKEILLHKWSFAWRVIVEVIGAVLLLILGFYILGLISTLLVYLSSDYLTLEGGLLGIFGGILIILFWVIQHTIIWSKYNDWYY